MAVALSNSQLQLHTSHALPCADVQKCARSGNAHAKAAKADVLSASGC